MTFKSRNLNWIFFPLLAETGSDGRTFWIHVYAVLPLYLNDKVIEERNASLILSSHLVHCVGSGVLQLLASAGWLQGSREGCMCLPPGSAKGCGAVDIGRMRVLNHGSSTPRPLLHVVLNRLVISALTPKPTRVFLALFHRKVLSPVLVLWQYLILTADGQIAFTKS